jgi:hypothetical protein
MSLLDTASLIVTPNAGKEGKLYSVVPSNGDGDFTVTRATTATRVNSEGLIELVPYNLFRYSEQFDNGAWVKTNATITTNATIAPNGTLTADKAIATNTASATRAVYQGFTPILNSTYNISVYVKAAEYTKFTISEIGNGRFGASFDLVAETSTSLGGLNYVSSLITNVGNGWYKCSIVATGSAVGWAVGFMGYPDGATPSTSGVSYAGNGVSGVFIWGAQLVEGSTPKDYLPTTTRLDIPRLDYTNGSCPSILVEPQRTNLVLRSEEFDNVNWNKIASTITANSTTSPSGVQNADTLTGTSAALGVRRIVQGMTVLNATNYTTSIYAKKGTNNFVQIFQLDVTFGPNAWANFDLNNGVVGSVGSSVTATITDVGNGWYRCSMTALSILGGNTSTSIILVTSATSPRAEQNTLTTSVFLWGAQLEAGAYPTSYIPTTSASVTRNADVIEKTGISDLIGQTEGTMFVDIELKAYDNLPKWIAFLGTGSAYIGIYTDSSSRFFAEITNAGIQFSNSTYTFSVGQRYKLAIAYKVNDFAFYINGTQVATDNSGTVPTTSQFGFQYNTIANNLTQRYYNSAALWKERLTNDQLATLTTI